MEICSNLSKISRYYLTMTKSCNLRCKYCLQGQDKPENLVPVDVRKVASYFPETGIYNLIFFGGEPFLLFDEMIEIARLVKEKNSHANMIVATNGTLLTVERADILNSLDFTIAISHDGFMHEELRGIPDFLKVNPEPFLALKNRSVAATITSLNWDFYRIWEYFDNFEAKYDTKVPVLLQVTEDDEGNTPEELFLYNNKAFEAMIDRVFANLKSSILNSDFTSREYLQYFPMIEKLNLVLNNPSYFGCRCGADTSSCHIDIHGNLYACHNAKNPNDHIDISGVQPGNYNPYRNLKECQECPAYLLCGGGCPMAHPTRRKYICYIEFQQYSRLLKVLNEVAAEGYDG
jgi:radical SAM protein with 4Fe4S-binding SPASM domain